MNNNKLTQPYIPTSDTTYEDRIQIDLANNGIKELVLQVPGKPVLDHELGMWNDINTFELDSWSPKRAGLKSGYKSIDDALDGGVKPGFYIIAADSNTGKTIFMSQIEWGIVENNADVYVLSFSLDDPLPDKIPKVIAGANKVLINAVKNPMAYTQYPLMLARRAEGLNKLRTNVDKYKLYDSSFSSFIEDIEEEVIKTKIALDASGLDKQVVVFVDNFHDLYTKKHPNFKETEKFNYLAQQCADIAIKYDIPLICTGEFRKMNGALRPTLDCIRDSIKIRYEAKAILLCHNDVHTKGEGADVYFTSPNSPLKQPVFEVHFAKNKFSSFKGRLFFESYPDMSRMDEASIQNARQYTAAVSGS